MSTLRITNIEAKADPSSPTVDEKIKLTNSNGDILVHIDGKTSGITTIGINTTAGNIKFDQNSNVVVTGIITATKFVGTIEPTTLAVDGNITSLGRLGVGTDNPGQKLVIYDNVPSGTSNVFINNAGGDGVLYILNNDQYSAGLGTLTDNGSYIDLSGKWTSASPAANRTFGRIGAFKENNTSANGAGYLGLYSRPDGSGLTERVRIDSAGKVGIGTENPLNGIDNVQSEGRLRVNRFSHLLMQNKNDSTTDYWAISARNGGELDIGYGTPDGNSLVTGDKLTITSAGQMGLGTVDPNSYGGSVKLAVANTSGTCGLSIVSATNGDGNLYYADGTSGDATYRGFIRYNHTTDQFRFGTAGAERMRLHSGGTLSVPTGIEFGSGLDGTSANTLDDYEEGTLSWRLQRSDNIGAGNNVNTRVTYTKIGNRVYISGYIYTQNTGNTTSGVNIIIRNDSNTSNVATLPYPPNHSGGLPVTGTRTISDNYRNMAVTFQENSSTVYLFRDDGDNNYVKNTNNVAVAQNQTHLVLQFCGSYTTNS